MERDDIKDRKDDGILDSLGLPEPFCDPHKAFSLTPTSWKDFKDEAPFSALLVVDGKEVVGQFIVQTSGFRPFSLLNNALRGRRNFDHRIVFKMKNWSVCVARVPQGLKIDGLLQAFRILRDQVIVKLTGTKIHLEDVLLMLKDLDVYRAKVQPQKESNVNSNANHNVNNNTDHNRNNNNHDASNGDSSEELNKLKKRNKELEDKLQKALEMYPEEFLCPILCEVMKEPVLLTDGHTYEKSAIAQWLSNHNTSPMTGAQLKSKDLIPNYTLKKMIVTHMEASNNSNGGK